MQIQILIQQGDADAYDLGSQTVDLGRRTSDLRPRTSDHSPVCEGRSVGVVKQCSVLQDLEFTALADSNSNSNSEYYIKTAGDMLQCRWLDDSNSCISSKLKQRVCVCVCVPARVCMCVCVCEFVHVRVVLVLRGHFVPQA